MKKNKNKILKLIIRILITSVLLFLVLNRIDLQQLSETFRNARWAFLIIIWLLVILNFVFMAVKMRFILAEQQCDARILVIFGSSAITSLYGLIMPGMLSTTVKWYILKKHTGKGMQVFSSMAYNQASDVVFKVLTGLIALIIVNPAGGWQLPVISLTAAVFIIIGTLVLLGERTGPVVNKFLQKSVMLLPLRFRPKAEGIFNRIQIFQTIRWQFHLKIILFNLITTIISAFVYYFAAAAAGIHAPISLFVLQSSIMYMLALIPISIANLGVREYTLLETLGQYGIAAPAALLMSAVIFSNKIFFSAIGAIYLLCWPVKIREVINTKLE